MNPALSNGSVHPPPLDFLIAASFGLPHEPAGVVVLQRIEELTGVFDRKRLRWTTNLRYMVPEIARPAGGSRLADIVGQVAELYQQAAGAARRTLLVDITVPGRPVVDLMLERGLRPAPIVVADSGQKARPAHGALSIPKNLLVSNLAILMGDLKIRVAKEHPLATTLARELADFRLRPAGDASGTSELVNAVSIAAWWSENRMRSIVHQPPAPRVPVEIRPPTFDEAVRAALERMERRSGV